jgi:phage terminase small subunit
MGRKKHDIPIKPLTDRQKAFVENYVKTGNAKQSAITAGFPAASAYQRGHEMATKVAATTEALKDVRKEVAEKLKYTAIEAMQECQDAIIFARETGNANAYVKAVELRSKLQGLLIEKHDVRQVGFSIRIDGVDDPSSIIPVVSTKVEDEDDETLKSQNSGDQDDDIFS